MKRIWFSPSTFAPSHILPGEGTDPKNIRGGHSFFSQIGQGRKTVSLAMPGLNLSARRSAFALREAAATI